MTKKSKIETKRIWGVSSQLRDCDSDDGIMNVTLGFSDSPSHAWDDPNPPLNGGMSVSTHASLTQEEADALAVALVQQNPLWTHGRDDLIQFGKPVHDSRVGVEMGSWFLPPEDCVALGLALIRAAAAATNEAAVAAQEARDIATGRR